MVHAGQRGRGPRSRSVEGGIKRAAIDVAIRELRVRLAAASRPRVIMMEDCTRPQGGLGGSYDTREPRSPPVIRRRRGVRKTESDSQTYDIDRLTRL